MRTFTEYIPSAIRNTHHDDYPLPPVERSVLDTGVYNTQVHTTGNVTFDVSCIKSAACSVLP